MYHQKVERKIIRVSAFVIASAYVVRVSCVRVWFAVTERPAVSNADSAADVASSPADDRGRVLTSPAHSDTALPATPQRSGAAAAAGSPRCRREDAASTSPCPDAPTGGYFRRSGRDVWRASLALHRRSRRRHDRAASSTDYDSGIQTTPSSERPARSSHGRRRTRPASASNSDGGERRSGHSAHGNRLHLSSFASASNPHSDGGNRLHLSSSASASNPHSDGERRRGNQLHLSHHTDENRSPDCSTSHGVEVRQQTSDRNRRESGRGTTTGEGERVCTAAAAAAERDGGELDELGSLPGPAAQVERRAIDSSPATNRSACSPHLGSGMDDAALSGRRTAERDCSDEFGVHASARPTTKLSVADAGESPPTDLAACDARRQCVGPADVSSADGAVTDAAGASETLSAGKLAAHALTGSGAPAAATAWRRCGSTETGADEARKTRCSSETEDDDTGSADLAQLDRRRDPTSSSHGRPWTTPRLQDSRPPASDVSFPANDGRDLSRLDGEEDLDAKAADKTRASSCEVRRAADAQRHVIQRSGERASLEVSDGQRDQQTRPENGRRHGGARETRAKDVVVATNGESRCFRRGADDDATRAQASSSELGAASDSRGGARRVSANNNNNNNNAVSMPSRPVLVTSLFARLFRLTS